jgi:hypothetical protein
MLASRIIERAYREAAIKALGDGLSSLEYAEGLERLNGFISSLFGGEIGQVLADWQVPGNLRTANAPSNSVALPYPQNLSVSGQPFSPQETPNNNYVFYPPANVRLVWGGQQVAEVFLPEYPSDGARIEIVNAGSPAALTVLGNGRRISGGASLTFAPGAAPLTLFYRADLADWLPVQPLALTDDHPLAPEFDELLVAGTAIRLTALDEISPQSGTMFIYERLLKRCQQRYFQPGIQAPNGDSLRPTEQLYRRGWVGPGWMV